PRDGAQRDRETHPEPAGRRADGDGTHRSAAASGRHDDGADPLAQEGARAGQAGQGLQGQEGRRRRRCGEGTQGAERTEGEEAAHTARRVGGRQREEAMRKPKTVKGKRKLKTNRAAAKRFKMTASGKIKRGHSMKRHILTKKAAGRKRKLR